MNLLSLNLFGQAIQSKTLPHPQFYLIGLEKKEFPKLNGEWNDTVALIKYGKEIDNWIQKNITTNQQINELKKVDSGAQINSMFFKSLNEEEKARFKEVAKLLSYIIVGQKNKLMTDYFNHHNHQKSKKDFYDEVEQIYFIQQDDLNTLFKMIKP